MNRPKQKIYLTALLTLALLLAACVPATPMPAAEGEVDATTGADNMTRETGATVTVQELGGITVHSYLAPEQVFADNTHIIETIFIT